MDKLKTQMRNAIARCPRPALAGAAGLAVFAMSTWLIAGAPSPLYTVIDLGRIGYVATEQNQASAQIFRINDNGFIAGTSLLNSGQQAVYTEINEGRYGAITALPVSMDGTGTPIATSAARGINIGNDVVGYEEQAGVRYATLWTRDGSGRWSMTHLQMKANYTSSEAWDINDRQEIVGSVTVDGTAYAAYWSEPANEPEILTVVDRSAPGVAPSRLVGRALAINNDGVITGVSGTDTFIKRPNEPHVTRERRSGTPDYIPYMQATGINAGGLVIANAVAPANRSEFSTYTPDTPWVWSLGRGLQSLTANPDLAAWTSAINDARYILGYQAEVPGISPVGFSNRSPLMYHLEKTGTDQYEWQPYDLRAQLPALPDGWEFYKATGLSNNGRIAVMAKLYDDWHLYVLAPNVADLAVDISPIPTALWTTDASIRTQLAAMTSPDQAPVNTLSVAALRVRNTGPASAQNVVVTANFDTVVQFDTIESSVISVRNEFISSYCLTNGERKGRSSITCHIGQLGADDFADIVFKFTTAAPGEFKLTADVSSTASDTLNRANNHSATSFKTVGFGPSAPTKTTRPTPAPLITVNESSDTETVIDAIDTVESAPTKMLEPLPPAGPVPTQPPPLVLAGLGGQANTGSTTTALAGGCSLGAPGQNDVSLLMLAFAALGLRLSRKRARN